MKRSIPHAIPASRRPRRAGFTLVEAMVVLAVVGVITSVAAPRLLNARRQASYTTARVLMRSLATQLAACALEREFPDDGGFPADVAPGVAPAGCPDLQWPDRDEVPFGSTLDYENWQVGGSRWVGITFMGEHDVRVGHRTHSDLGSGFTTFEAAGNINYALAIESP